MRKSVLKRTGSSHPRGNSLSSLSGRKGKNKRSSLNTKDKNMDEKENDRNCKKINVIDIDLKTSQRAGEEEEDDSSENPSQQRLKERKASSGSLAVGGSPNEWEKCDSNSSSSKLTSNSITSRSMKASCDSLVDSNMIATGSKIFKSSNNSFAVPGSISGTSKPSVSEYKTICSKEEIKESINSIRCGKVRESHVHSFIRSNF